MWWYIFRTHIHLISNGSGITMNRGGGIVRDCWSSMIHLGMSSSVVSICWVVVGIDSVSLATISVVSSIPSMSSCTITTLVVVGISVMDSIVSSSCTMISSNSVMAGFFVVGVSFFVSGSLVENTNEALYTFDLFENKQCKNYTKHCFSISYDALIIN